MFALRLKNKVGDFIMESFEEKSKEFEKKEKSYAYSKIKKSLLEQIKKSEVAKEVFEDLVKDYMKLYVVKELLFDDIRKNGVNMSSKNTNGYIVTKRNPSVTEVYKVNLQMIKLLDKLKLEPVVVEEVVEEDDEL